jgi:antirestriction protein ArdC
MFGQSEIRERVNSEIIAALQSGLTPWRKPWCNLENTGLPANVISKKLCRGINPLLLQLAAHGNGFASKFWGTYTQLASLGGQVKKRPDDVPRGAWGTKVIYWKPVATVRKNAKGEEEKATFPLLREYTVFNADQVEGADKFRVHAPTGTTVIDYEPAEGLIQATRADIRHVAGLEAAYYRPPPTTSSFP